MGGPLIREQMMEERRNWFTDVMVEGHFPENLNGYYLMKNPPPPEEEKKADEGADADAGKKKKKGKGPEGPPEQPPQLTGPSEVTTTLLGHVANYDNLWLDRDESNNFAQEYDVDLAKDCVRPNIE